jgi:hypothetical protein
MRNGDHFEFYREITKLVTSFEDNLGDLIRLWIILIQTFEKEDKIFKRNLKAPETEEANKIDRERMKVFQLIKLRVRATFYDIPPDEHADAVALDFLLKNYKEIPTATLTEASALIVNLVQDLRRPRYATHVATLGLTGTVDRLEAVNEAFEAIYVQREHNVGNALRQGNMKRIRPQVDKAFSHFIEGLEIFYNIARLNGNTTGIATCGAIIDGINNIIHQYNNIYAHVAANRQNSRT